MFDKVLKGIGAVALGGMLGMAVIVISGKGSLTIANDKTGKTIFTTVKESK